MFLRDHVCNVQSLHCFSQPAKLYSLPFISKSLIRAYPPTHNFNNFKPELLKGNPINAWSNALCQGHCTELFMTGDVSFVLQIKHSVPDCSARLKTSQGWLCSREARTGKRLATAADRCASVEPNKCHSVIRQIQRTHWRSWNMGSLLFTSLLFTVCWDVNTLHLWRTQKRKKNKRGGKVKR